MNKELHTTPPEYRPRAITFIPESAEQEAGIDRLRDRLRETGRPASRASRQTVLRAAVNLLLVREDGLEAICAEGFDE